MLVCVGVTSKNSGLYQLKVVDMWTCEMMNDYEILQVSKNAKSWILKIHKHCNVGVSAHELTCGM